VGDFADQLEKAIERSRRVSPTMIEGNVISTEASDTASNTKTLNGKPTIIDRRYRKW
jgi:hypothetical protein